MTVKGNTYDCEGSCIRLLMVMYMTVKVMYMTVKGNVYDC
jgi:hypothetical protein